jgi:hypothetical protein
MITQPRPLPRDFRVIILEDGGTTFPRSYPRRGAWSPSTPVSYALKETAHYAAQLTKKSGVRVNSVVRVRLK